MSAALHTPGPLGTVGNLVRTSMAEDGTPRGIMVAECFDQHGDPFSDEAKANARLFASASELLEALRALLAEVTTPDEKWIEGSAVNRARAAVAKATGSAA